MNGIITLVFLSISLTVFAQGSKDAVVATVNGKKIYKSELERLFQQNLLFVSHKKVTRNKILDDLINRRLGIDKGYAKKIDKNVVVKEKIEDIIYHAQISADLEGRLKKLSDQKISDNEVAKYYKENKEYRTSHILFRLRANPSKNDVKNAYNVARGVYTQAAKDPSKFSELATRYSQTNVAQFGGDLGYQPPTKYAPEYFTAIKGKNSGYISEPIRTQYGLHVIKITGIKPVDKINKNLYKKIIYDIKRDKILDDYHKGLRANAKIKINSQNM
jgi:parvulin-like peptidyl-prolyl isomerase